jgi:RNA polymerase subunit RPABC4/transcription elongation factor Spt4
MRERGKVCRNCRLFVEGDVCPLCNESNFSRSWKGMVIINDPEGSAIAKTIGVTKKGKYCLWVK